VINKKHLFNTHRIGTKYKSSNAVATHRTRSVKLYLRDRETRPFVHCVCQGSPSYSGMEVLEKIQRITWILRGGCKCFAVVLHVSWQAKSNF